MKETNILFRVCILGLFLLLSNFYVIGQSCGNTWSLVNNQRGFVFRAVTHNGSLLVAVGDEGILWTSTDGFNWTAQTSNGKATFAVMYKSKFVAVGSRGYIITSSDGINWVERANPATDGLWGVTYGDGKYVVVGNGGTIMTSTDGNSWTKRNSPTSSDLKDVVYGGSQFVAVGGGGTVLTSPDGISWTQRPSLADGLRSVAYGGGVYVAGGRDLRIYRSTDGISWSLKYSGTGSYYVQDLVYTGSNFVGVGTKGFAANSSDGSSWSVRNSKATSTLMGVTYFDEKVIACGLSGYFTVSLCNPGAASPLLVVASPNGGEEYNRGSLETIKWGSFGTVGNVKLEYTTNNGNSWSSIIDSTANDGEHSWTIPVVESSQCLIRVSEAADGSPSDTSNAKFTIGGVVKNTITLTSPNGGENWEAGSTHNITWTGSVSFSKIDIEYYDGNTWNVIVTGTADDGVYSWTVPDIATTSAKVWIKGYDGGTNPTDYSNNTFTISGGQSTKNTITLIAPNGGEILTAGNNYSIKWTGSVSFSKIDIEYNNGSKWNVIVNGTKDDGVYNWTVPNVSTSKAQIWIKGYDGGTNPTDYSDETFTISTAPTSTITVTSPNGGEVWAKGSTENITWTSSGEVGNVRIYYSTDSGFGWNTIISSTANDGSYAWKLPNIIDDDCLVKVSEVSNSQVSDISNSVFSIGGPPEIVLSKTGFNFGYIKNGASPCVQTLFIYNGGGGTLNWSAAADVSWINVGPTSGTGGGIVTISINTLGLNTGNYEGSVIISDTAVSNSPQSAKVYLTVKNGNQDKVPFGIFATPEDGLTGVSGSIAVTGWALDDTCVESVKIYREVNGDLSFIGDAVFVEGARPDVEEAYPDYPSNSGAGWGYMMLTNFLPDGQLILKAIATDTTGHQVVLGTKIITVDNANAVKPFGAIDTPTQGGGASGSKFRNNGWALTPIPNKIPEDGSTINVFVDGQLAGKVNYNLYRSDIADFFPGYANSDGAWGYLDFDTTAYSNGVHTIAWGVTDNAGNTDGIGSRYFSIQNTGGASVSSTSSQMHMKNVQNANPFRSLARLRRLSTHIGDIPADRRSIRFRKGYNENIELLEAYPTEQDIIPIEIKELDRLEIRLGTCECAGKAVYAAYMPVGDEIRRLPAGTTLNTKTGVFYWQTAAGFIGQYEFVFLIQDRTGGIFKKHFLINITPQFSK